METEFERLVIFVKDKNPDFADIDGLTIDMIEQPPGGGHHYVGDRTTNGRLLSRKSIPAIKRKHLQSRRKRSDDIVNLLDQFSRRRDDDRSRRDIRLKVTDTSKDGDRKSKCLS